MKKNQYGFTLVEVMLILLVTTVISLTSWSVWHSRQNTTSDVSSTSTVQSSTQQNKEPATQSQVENGNIMGSLGYPSSGNPAQKVCAVNVVSDADVTCTTTTDGQNTFTIAVKPASYYVYSSLVKTTGDFTPSYRAYYNEYSRCGNAVNCPDVGHKQYIEVRVAREPIIFPFSTWDCVAGSLFCCVEDCTVEVEDTSDVVFCRECQTDQLVRLITVVTSSINITSTRVKPY